MNVREKKFSKIIFFKLFYFLLLISSIIFFKEFNDKEIKVCLCTPGKNENKYIKEFVEHYKNYGVDKIFLYDNNDLDGEFFEKEINDYINDKFVEIVNFRGKKKALLLMMNDCYRKNFRNYDWLIFFEIDEYIYLKDFTNIKEYLNNTKFIKCQKIHLNWVFHTDNNLLYYENRPLKERFPEKEDKAKKNINNISQGIKSILKGHIPNIKINCVHSLNSKLKSCDGFGNIKKINGIITSQPDFRNYYIDHYNFKSTEEFINKINTGDALFFKDNQIDRIKVYFGINKITLEKIQLVEKGTGINLSVIRNQLKKIS
jgi:hypothetical protein